VNSCWHNPTTGETLLTSAPITYQGRAAELLVYSKAGDPAKADVVVISPACTTPTKAGAPVTSYSLLSPMVLAETEITRP
jgi:hypothetical protein